MRVNAFEKMRHFPDLGPSACCGVGVPEMNLAAERRRRQTGGEFRPESRAEDTDRYSFKDESHRCKKKNTHQNITVHLGLIWTPGHGCRDGGDTAAADPGRICC